MMCEQSGSGRGRHRQHTTAGRGSRIGSPPHQPVARCRPRQLATRQSLLAASHALSLHLELLKMAYGDWKREGKLGGWPAGPCRDCKSACRNGSCTVLWPICPSRGQSERWARDNTPHWLNLTYRGPYATSQKCWKSLKTAKERSQCPLALRARCRVCAQVQAHRPRHTQFQGNQKAD